MRTDEERIDYIQRKINVLMRENDRLKAELEQSKKASESNCEFLHLIIFETEGMIDLSKYPLRGEE